MSTNADVRCSISNTKVALGRLLGIPVFLLIGALVAIYSIDQFRSKDKDRHPYWLSIGALMCFGFTYRLSKDIVFRADFSRRCVQIRRLFSNPTYDYQNIRIMMFSANVTTVQGLPVHKYYLMTIAFLDGHEHEFSVSMDEVGQLAVIAKEGGFSDRIAFPGTKPSPPL